MIQDRALSAKVMAAGLAEALPVINQSARIRRMVRSDPCEGIGSYRPGRRKQQRHREAASGGVALT